MPNFEKLNDGVADIARFVGAREWNEGDMIEGIYCGSFQSGNYDNWTHKIYTPDGEILGVSGTAQIDPGIENARIGQWLRIAYQGAKSTQSGNLMGLFDVQGATDEDDETKALYNKAKGAFQKDKYRYKTSEQSADKQLEHQAGF